MRPELKLLGVGAACAACCAIPVALPAIAGLSLTSLGFSTGGTVIGLITGAAALLGLGFVVLRRRAAKACAPSASTGCGCSSTKQQVTPKARSFPWTNTRAIG